MSDPFPDVPFDFIEPPRDEATNQDLAELIEFITKRSHRFEDGYPRSKYAHGLLAMGLMYFLQQHSGPAGIVFAKSAMSGLLDAACREPWIPADATP